MSTIGSVSIVRLAAVLSLVVATSGIVMAARQPASGIGAPLQVPMTIDGWEGQDAAALDEEVTEMVAADQVVNRSYVNDAGAEAALYIAHYQQQRPGVSIHSPLHCLPGTGWEVLSNRSRQVELAGRPGAVRQLVAQKGDSRVMILYWYSIQGRMIANDALSRLQLLSNRVRLGRNDASLVRIVVPIDVAEADAERRALAFAAALTPHL
jgi:EpsI family protein